MRLTVALVTAGLAAGAVAAMAQDAPHRFAIREMVRPARAGAYQGRDRRPEQTDRFTRKVKLGRDGRVSIQNISGDIVVTGGSGDEVSIEATKRARGDQSRLADVRIVVDERPGRVDIRTEYEQYRGNRNNNVSVDYTVVVPAGAAVELKSISGNVKATGIRGAVRAESVSGDVVTSGTPNVEAAKTISGDVTLEGITTDGNLSIGSVSGTVHARNVKARGLDLGSVSGDVMLTDVSCERLSAKSVSGGFEYTGSLARGGVYDVNVHSGTVRFVLANPAGFELTANTFSGSIRSDIPLTIGGSASASSSSDRDGRRRGVSSRSMRGTFGDGSATLTLRTFSGDIVIARR